MNPVLGGPAKLENQQTLSTGDVLLLQTVFAKRASAALLRNIIPLVIGALKSSSKAQRMLQKII